MKHPFVGKDVLVTWRDDDCDWSHYTLIHIGGGWVTLRGRPDSNGSPFNGGDILVPASDVVCIELVRERR